MRDSQAHECRNQTRRADERHCVTYTGSKVPDSTIIDNQGDNTLQAAIIEATSGAKELCVATAFFTLDALAMVAEHLHECDRVRILFGPDSSRTQRGKLMELLRLQSDRELAERRINDPTLTDLVKVESLFKDKRIEARCYTAMQFHAKAYIAELREPERRRARFGILGSGNFTRSGLTKNIELNVDLTAEQTERVKEWFEERWEEAVDDDVTDAVEKEIKRQIDLYDPYSIYVKALLTWGDWVQGRGLREELKIREHLDPHQEDAYLQALKILKRENGVMICDGVGLGKSFVALALMEHFLANGKTAFLIAPQSILKASWANLLTKHLKAYTRGYCSLVVKPMTWFGFDPNKKEPAIIEKEEHLLEFAAQAEVIVIDESHNFRKMNTQRYENLLRMLQNDQLGPKQIILMTATPLNTQYVDLTSQFRLITRDGGRIGGIEYETYRKHAVKLDREQKKTETENLDLDYMLGHHSLGFLEQGMSAIAIQRSRKTCKQLAAAKGKLLRFPDREPITTINYELSPLFSGLVDHARREFEELAKFLFMYRSEVKRASEEKDVKKKKLMLALPERGLRFSAYLPDRYRIKPDDSLREAQVESFLVSLVFTNVMKQMESSPAAFQGILQALGSGLCARLHHVANNGDLPQDEIDAVKKIHAEWISTDIKSVEFKDDEDEDEDVSDVEDAIAADASGEEMDEWLEKALKNKSVQKGLDGFGATTHDVELWRRHIETDLSILKEIHVRTREARSMEQDLKLVQVTSRVREMLGMDRKVLIFTQSKRTAEYVEHNLKEILGDQVARIDASIDGDRRARILHSFSPKYNPLDQPELELDFEPINVLISTDVLSEGVNLQEAGYVLSYDIHWNPVRLIQRIGRVDRRLNDDDPGHTIAIENVVPPKQLEDILRLVETVEGRKRMIFNLLGLDQAFFTAQDPSGTLKEFNATVEGEVSARDEALKAYDKMLFAHAKEVDRSDAAPNGAFGVWKGAPSKGFFALFELALKDNAPTVDKERFEKLIGQPIFALQQDGELTWNAPDVLRTLATTVPQKRSGDPKAAIEAKGWIKKLRLDARNTIGDLGLTQSIELRLVCAMELQP